MRVRSFLLDTVPTRRVSSARLAVIHGGRPRDELLGEAGRIAPFRQWEVPIGTIGRVPSESLRSKGTARALSERETRLTGALFLSASGLLMTIVLVAAWLS